MSSFHTLLRANIIPLPSVELLHQHFHLINFHFLDFLSFFVSCSFSISLSLNPSFHALIPLSCIFLQIYSFHPSRSTCIPRFTIPFTLTSLRHIQFTISNSPNLLHICLHLDHHLDWHPISIRHALPISDTILSSNTTLNIYFTIVFASLSSKILHSVSPQIN